MTPEPPSFEPRPFRPASWAGGPHVQTLLARAFRRDEGPAYRRERLDTPDDDFLDLDWMPEPAPGAPVALVLHGLEGSARRRYVRNVCTGLHARGVWPVALNFRACSGEPNRRPRMYHSGATGDVAHVLETLRKRHPRRSMGAMGVSLGGNILLKLLGERGEEGRELLQAAAVLSVPYDLDAGCRLLEAGGMGSFYSWYFLRSLKSKVRAKAKVLEAHLDLREVEAAPTLRRFDDLATAPLHGFESAAEYYRLCSSSRFLDTVRVPTLLIHSLDDPFLPRDAIPRARMDANPWLQPVVTERGGHVGFMEGPPWSPRFWADEEITRFLSDTLRGQVPADISSSPEAGGER